MSESWVHCCLCESRILITAKRMSMAELTWFIGQHADHKAALTIEDAVDEEQVVGPPVSGWVQGSSAR